MKNNNYIGWIPCVNGNLDFGLMKVGIKGGFTDKKINDEKVIEKNFSQSGVPGKHDRLITLQSRVNWRDSKEHDESLGAFRIFVTARVAVSNHMESRHLSGDILLYPQEAEPLDKQEIHNVSIHEISHGITEENVATEFPKLETQVNNPKNITGLHPDCFKVSFSFSVTSTGIIRLKLNSTSDELDDHSSYLLARQAFYYLKYSIHSHRHHVDEQDSLTTITPETEGCGLRLVCQLKRELTSLSRTQRVENRLHETNIAKGIIGYAKSLLLGLNREGLITEDELIREKQYFENVSASFESQEQTISRAEQKLEMIKAKSKVWLGFCLIFSWGFTNFNFMTDSKVKLNDGLSWSIPTFIVLFAVLLYMTSKKYYFMISSPHSLVKIYETSGLSVLIKVLLASFCIVALLTVWWFGLIN